MFVNYGSWLMVNCGYIYNDVIYNDWWLMYTIWLMVHGWWLMTWLTINDMVIYNDVIYNDWWPMIVG